ncbi:hypothetical protein VNO78_23335 [Psophocarpus tetragonolobus]|uniref:Uncharacterized protein n=1 Tax=Psophocarpus tetragonolobus TaxID=3891 RepID=A0AAN9S3J9_PSOTE
MTVEMVGGQVHDSHNNGLDDDELMDHHVALPTQGGPSISMHQNPTMAITHVSKLNKKKWVRTKQMQPETLPLAAANGDVSRTTSQGPALGRMVNCDTTFYPGLFALMMA